jgi:short-subunit dehydrogenase
VKIPGSTVLLTGATGGIGQAISRALAARGAELILTGRRGEQLAELALALGARTIPADLSVRADVDDLIEQAGRVDILISNAALPASGSLASFTAEEIDRALEVNVRAPLVLANALTPAMLERREGHLLFMSSLAGRAGSTRTSIYNASKFALRGFASGLRAELHGTGVGVSAVFPGFIRDAGMFADSGATLPRGVRTRSPQDVARAVIGAVEHNRGEVDVAPLSLRLGAVLGTLAPDTAAAMSRRLGAEEIGRAFEDGQRTKR